MRRKLVGNRGLIAFLHLQIVQFVQSIDFEDKSGERCCHWRSRQRIMKDLVCHHKEFGFYHEG